MAGFYGKGSEAAHSFLSGRCYHRILGLLVTLFPIVFSRAGGSEILQKPCFIISSVYQLSFMLYMLQSVRVVSIRTASKSAIL